MRKKRKVGVQNRVVQTTKTKGSVHSEDESLDKYAPLGQLIKKTTSELEIEVKK